jgi:D-alanine transaminase
MESEILYLNGSFMPLSEGRIPVEDRGFELGDGVYEVIKIMNGRLVWLDDHLDRLERSLDAVSLSEAIAGHSLETALPDLVRRSSVEHGMVYLQVTRGWAPRDFRFPRPPHPTVLAYARQKAAPAREDILCGTVLHPVEDLRWARCDIKSTNLLAAVLAKEAAHQAGADEALFMAPDGTAREGGSSNVFAFLNGVLRTHPLSNRILGGITRMHLLASARVRGYAVEERAFSLQEVFSSGEDVEVFSASTTRDIMPVVRIGDAQVGSGSAGPVTLTLLDIMRREQAELVGLRSPEPLATALPS